MRLEVSVNKTGRRRYAVAMKSDDYCQGPVRDLNNYLLGRDY